MALGPGTRLGPYEVLDALGAGGMGEVYRARDTRLGRTVALKVLPPHFASDPLSRKRFEQEARAVSALNHPHICTLFDVGSEGGADFLVMEFLEGQSLAARLEKGPLPILEALEHAIHIADALGRAHRSGIVHRDVKPGNVMLTKDGAKLLDFGLARARPAAVSAVSMTRTASAEPLTNAGLVVGTVPYMSPEQLEGRETDARTDIFSLGALIYEMLAARRPFDGESQASVIAQIMTADPSPLSEILPVTPASLDRLLRQCLAKDPDKRWQSASDLARQLESILEEVRAPKSGSRPAAVPVARWWRTTWGRRGIAVAALLVVAVAAGAAYVIGTRTGTPALPTFHRLTFRRGTVLGARFTTDGRNVIYAARWDGNPNEMYSVSADGVDSDEREALKGFNLASISRRNELALLKGSTLAVAPFSGGAPRDLARSVTSADWSPDGTRLAVTRSRAVEYPLGTVIYRASSAAATVADVRVSPSGNLLTFSERMGGHGRFVIIDARGRKLAASSFIATVNPPVWHPRGDEVWFSATAPDAPDAIRALNLSGRERSVLRAPSLILKDISSDGRALLASDHRLFAIRGKDPGSAAERDLTYYGWSLLDDLSADGRTILFTEGGDSDVENGWNIYMRGTDGAPPQRVGPGAYGRLSPDKQWVVAVFREEDGAARLRVLPTGPGSERDITPLEPHTLSIIGWLGDSSAVIYNRAGQIWIVPLSGEPRALSPEGWTGQDVVSADGRFVCATTDPEDPWIYMCTVGSPISRALPRLYEGSRWLTVGFTRDPRKLWVTPQGVSVTRPVFTMDLGSGAVTPWKEFGAQVDRAGLGVTQRVFVSADGDAYAYTFTRRLSTLYVVGGLR